MYHLSLKVSRHFRKELVVLQNHSSLRYVHHLNRFDAGLWSLNAWTQTTPHATPYALAHIPTLVVDVVCYTTLFSWLLLHPTPGLVLSHQAPSCTS